MGRSWGSKNDVSCLSEMNSVQSRGQAPKAPERGSFPLDHLSECTLEFQLFMECMKKNEMKNAKCKRLSAQYLNCRMDSHLMARTPLDKIGHGEEQIKKFEKLDNAEVVSKESKGFIAG